MGCGCKKKTAVPTNPAPLARPVPPPPPPTTLPKARARLIIRENMPHAPFPLRNPQPPTNDVDKLMEKLKTFTTQKPT